MTYILRLTQDADGPRATEILEPETPIEEVKSKTYRFPFNWGAMWLSYSQTPLSAYFHSDNTWGSKSVKTG